LKGNTTVSKIDLANRRKVMNRSIKLGHCICDPKRPCPCTVFTNQGICPCAGERPDPISPEKVKLTELVHNAGCASKIAASDLELFLSRLPTVDDPAIISGLAAGDDAGVYKLTDDIALVQTVDVFTPCVDDPFTFGKICAANCLSDVYAMGGIPKTALSILAFPSETLNGEIMYLMLAGAMETLKEARCSLLGGHSIKDEEIKLGFAITGIIAPGKSVALETAQPGDIIVLTKPLGVGVLNFARQIGRVHAQGLQQAEESMMTLNRAAAEAMMEVGVSACTDITGFGLFGHLTRMLRHSNVSAKIYADSLPSFDGALEFLADGVIPGAIERNSEFVGSDIVVEDGVGAALKNLCFDAQTSGGLMITLPKLRHAQLMTALKERGVAGTTIGEIVEDPQSRIELVNGDGT
jgi:selenide,water dikinase